MFERPRADLTGVVLCGGRSLRMGTDKAALRLVRSASSSPISPTAGGTLLERAAAELDRVACETLLACGRTERYRELGRALVLDTYEDGGPLAGLEAALARTRTDWLAARACDMPRAEPRVFLALLERAEKGDLDACFLRTEKGIEPLCAVYRRTCLAPVRAALSSGERKVLSFLGHPKPSGELPWVGTLAEAELPEGLATAGVAQNLNTPGDLRSEIEAQSCRGGLGGLA